MSKSKPIQAGNAFVKPFKKDAGLLKALSQSAKKFAAAMPGIIAESDAAFRELGHEPPRSVEEAQTLAVALGMPFEKYRSGNYTLAELHYMLLQKLLAHTQQLREQRANGRWVSIRKSEIIEALGLSEKEWRTWRRNNAAAIRGNVYARRIDLNLAAIGKADADRIEKNL
jgi:hypothetical protein